MSSSSQTRRSLALQSTALLVGVLLGGCSSADLASGALDGYGDELGGDGDGDEEDPSNTSESEGDDETGQTDGEEEEGDETPPEGIEDTGLPLDQCDPQAVQVLSYDLEDAQLEIAPTLVREAVLGPSGMVPNIPLSARPFLNNFQFNYALAEGDAPEITGELWKPPMVNAEAAPRYRLQYAIRGPQIPAEQRPPIDLAVVVDLGPSMADEPLLLAEEALAAIEAALVPGDRVTLIGAGETPEILAESTMIDNFGVTPLTGFLGEKSPESAADVGAALALAYELIDEPWQDQGKPRVLLISNGHFKAEGEVAELVEDHAEDGRYLIGVGVGDPDLFAHESLRLLAMEGRGTTLYARSPDDLWLDLNERFASHVIAAAIELEVTLTLPPGLAIREREPLAPKPGEPELGMLGVNDMLVFHHELESCGELADDATVVVEIEWTDPVMDEAKEVVWEHPVAELGYGSTDTRKGAAAVAYARALRGYRDGKPSDQNFGAVLDALSLITEALEAQPEDGDLIEMSLVLGKLEG